MDDKVKAKVKSSIDSAQKPDYQGEFEQESRLRAPPVMAPIGFHGILREVVEIATRNSEASPVAIAANYLANFAACLGRGPYQRIGDGICHNRPFVLLVGKSAKARKGTSENTPRRILERMDELLEEEYKQHGRLKVHTGGLSSGEGVGYALRDPTENKKGEVTDEGVTDKRLLIIEPEFANAMVSASREKSTLSAVVRNLWDGRDIEPLVKNSRWRASQPHAIIMGHITLHELVEKMSDTDAHSGFLNRFVILYVSRAKLVADPKPTSDEEINLLACQLAAAVQTATEDIKAENNRQIFFSEKAMGYWIGLYENLTREQDGVVGALLARSEIYCRMLAMLFALLDKVQEIDICHIDAAMAWVNYWRESVEYIFGDIAELQEAEAIQAMANEILSYVQQNQGCSRTDITTHFRNKHSAGRLDLGLEHLLNAAPPLVREEKSDRADGKPGKRKSKFWAD